MKLGAMAKQAKSAPLSNVYDYFHLGGQAMDASDPGTAHGGEAGMGTWNPSLEWADVGGQAENQNAAPVRFNAPENLMGAVTWDEMGAGTENGGRHQFTVDPTKLPETRFGPVTGTGRVDAHTRLYNPSMVYDDPNYGRITDARNIDTRSISDYFGPAALALATWGMGALGAPSLAMQGLQLGRGVLSGNGVDWGRILGMVAPYLNIPGEAVTLGRLAAGFADRNGRG